jgi:hypothetical protein
LKISAYQVPINVFMLYAAISDSPILLLDYLTRLLYQQNEVTVSFRVSLYTITLWTIVYLQTVHGEIQSKTKAVDELCLSINDRISAHMIRELYDRNTERCETSYFSDYKRVYLAWVSIDNGLMLLGRNRI